MPLSINADWWKQCLDIQVSWEELGEQERVPSHNKVGLCWERETFRSLVPCLSPRSLSPQRRGDLPFPQGVGALD